jgi:group I intron endonuclease
MTKKPMNYNNAVIYKIYCKNSDIKDIYVGSTTNFKKRVAGHKRICNTENHKNYNLNLYKCIRNNGNWNNWNMSVIEEYKCNNKLELHRRERYYIETFHAKLNMSFPCQTKNEWREKNKDKIKQQQKEYYQKNRDKLLQHQKEYVEKNKDKRRQQLKKYNQTHKLTREQKDIKNELRRVKITCECGAVVCRGGMTNHKKTEKHNLLMNQFTPALE